MKTFLIIILLFEGYLFIKNFVVFNASILLSDSILEYNLDSISKSDFENSLIDYSVIMGYCKALMNPLIYSYKQMVPKDILKKLEPYINKRH